MVLETVVYISPYWVSICMQFRANPGKYPDAGLTTYLPEAKKLGLADEDILMDMHQMVCVGAYGGVTSAVCPLPFCA